MKHHKLVKQCKQSHMSEHVQWPLPYRNYSVETVKVTAVISLWSCF